MDMRILRTLYDHGNWATRRVFEAARRLDDGALDRTIDKLGSLRELLIHLVDAHGYWLARAQGVEPQPRLTAVDKPGVEALFAEWKRLEASVSAMLTTLDDGGLQRIVRYTNPSGAPQAYPLWQILAHQLLHAVQHRSELALALSQYGHSPGWLDVLVFVDETSAPEGMVGDDV
jgi:uncharacterized damage-inducible protein DinB